MTYIIKNPNEVQRLLCERWQAEGSDVIKVKNNEKVIVTESLIEEDFRPFGAFIEEKTTEQIVEALYLSRSINPTIALF
jgi:hypothetical protein